MDPGAPAFGIEQHGRLYGKSDAAGQGGNRLDETIVQEKANGLDIIPLHAGEVIEPLDAEYE